MSNVGPTRTLDRAVLAVMVVQLIAVTAAALAWLWSQFWLYASVNAMSEDRARDGALAKTAAELGVDRFPSLGAWLMQGHDGRAFIAGAALAAAGALGPIVGIALLVLRRGDVRRAEEASGERDANPAAVTSTSVPPRG